MFVKSSLFFLNHVCVFISSSLNQLNYDFISFVFNLQGIVHFNQHWCPNNLYSLFPFKITYLFSTSNIIVIYGRPEYSRQCF